MLSLGWQEMVAIFIVALVLFGPKKLPELGRTIGRAMAEFRRASSELKATFDREMQQIERENESIKHTASTYMNDVYGSYDSTHYDPDGHNTIESHDSTTASHPEPVSVPAISDAESNVSAHHPADVVHSVAAHLEVAGGTVARDGHPAVAAHVDPAQHPHDADGHAPSD